MKGLPAGVIIIQAEKRAKQAPLAVWHGSFHHYWMARADSLILFHFFWDDVSFPSSFFFLKLFFFLIRCLIHMYY